MTVLSDPTVDGAADLEAPADLPDDVMAGNGHRDHPAAPEPDVDDLAVDDTEPEPVHPAVPVRKRQVRGRYRGATSTGQVELRVDVDGARATKRVSGDFVTTTGATTSYFGSFVVHAPTITTTPTQVRIQGTGSFTWRAGARLVLVTIPRVAIGAPPRPATLEFRTVVSKPGTSYLCAFASTAFRTIAYEQDSVAGAVPFVSYDTGSLPRPASSPARVLTVPRAYAEAGLELVTSGATNVVPVSAAGAGASPTWSDSELHNAMVNHFSLFANQPRWQVWMLVATRYDDPGVRGIMFDYSDGFQRQGAAVFHDAVAGTGAADVRAQLRTYVHELGHAFNLLHSWQKGLADPPQPLGPNGGLGDLSWMNYAWKYQATPQGPGGEPAYWAAFPFQFTHNELVHLRHGFQRDVIMGANPFGKGAAEIDPAMFEEPVIDHSGLALDLRASKPGFGYGEPVVVELKLSATDLRGCDTHGYLHPNDDLVTIGIRQPSGRTVVYRPMLRHCVDEQRRVHLDPGRPAVYDSAYIGFGRDGFLFDAPGSYQLRASYIADDGSRVLSPVLRLRVRPPATREDEEVGELLLGEQQGQILALLGSDAAALQGGADAMQTLAAEHAEHPLAVYARLASGVNAQRDYKDLGSDKVLRVRDARTTDSITALREVERASTGGGGVDNITLSMAMRTQARAEAKAGHPDRAAKVMDRMVATFEGKQLNPQVLQTIRHDAEATSAALAAEFGGDHRSGRRSK